MASRIINPPEALLVGRRALDGIKECVLLDDWEWNGAIGRWLLHCSITLEIEASEFVPATTEWYVQVSPEYPWGEVVFYPASIGGLQHTFHHQNSNGASLGDEPWRQGRLCVDTTLHALGRYGYDVEPYSADDRLAWHVRRVIDWIRQASAGGLAQPDDPFELPDFRQRGQSTLAFNETHETLRAWTSISEQVGLADLARVPGAAATLYVRQFKTLKGQPLLDVEWGKLLADSREAEPTAVWIRAPLTPVIEPWQAPMTWGELRTALEAQDVVLDTLLAQGAARIRDGQGHVLFIGFPIPEVVGGSPARMHWIAAKIPPLTVRSPDGFRTTNDRGRWREDRNLVLTNTREVEWLHTDNWSDGELTGRGRMSSTLTEKRIALVGVGALGSVIAETLVRAGVHNVTVCDGDFLQAGNLVRHTLTMQSMGINKAEAIAKRLNDSSPHASVSAVGKYLPREFSDESAWLAQADLVIDCTGSDEALSRLGRLEFPDDTAFASISLGMRAQRAFVFLSRGRRFPHDEYLSALDPWLRKEMEENAGLTLPREGIGCWHPAFPARVDDVWMMAAASVRTLEAMLASATDTSMLSVTEQTYHEGRFSGLRPARID